MIGAITPATNQTNITWIGRKAGRQTAHTVPMGLKIAQSTSVPHVPQTDDTIDGAHNQQVVVASPNHTVDNGFRFLLEQNHRRFYVHDSRDLLNDEMKSITAKGIV
jgi:hypothetical protein